jgi:hypothetical protein
MSSFSYSSQNIQQNFQHKFRSLIANPIALIFDLLDDTLMKFETMLPNVMTMNPIFEQFNYPIQL